MKKLFRRIKYITLVIERWLNRKLRFIVLPGFDGMPLYDVLVFFFRGLFKGVITYRAAAIAFNFFLALIPFVLFLFTLIPFVTSENYQADLLDMMVELLPANIYHMAETTIIGVVSRPSTGLLSLVFLTTVYFATNGIDAILQGFGQSYHAEKLWPWWRQKLTALVMLTGFSVLIFFVMGLLGFGKLVIDVLYQQGVFTSQVTLFWLSTLRWVIIFVFLLLTISSLYFFGQPKNRQQNKYRFISPGSLLGTILFILGGLLLKLYFQNLTRYNLIYGSLGSIIVLMIWLYYNALILLIGYELNASIRQTKAKKARYRVVE